ncbi:MAG: DNA alkylation repair protein [Proteobacteria bacterium]|nr:DNA alkylation repair protein [Pseudomonadota bacterium]MCP4917150.1 DNA alkylation repair protein [Pseudomonadota bacterium]
MTAFKEEISIELVERIARELHLDDEFVRSASEGLDGMELKERVRHVAQELRQVLPASWPMVLSALSALEGQDLGGLGGWPILQVIEDGGLEHPDESMAAIRRLTSMFSGEFAVRPFLRADPVGMLAVMRSWTSDPDEHVRRLASEGCRPRLPWGGHIRPLQQDPTGVLELLEDLRDDDSEYVRRSVANNLNDIAKDHPARVVEVCGRWMEGVSRDRQRLVRHALRSLVKAGDVGALAVLGVTEPRLEVLRFDVTSDVEIGQPVELVVELDVDGPQKLIVDYRVHFVGKKGPRKKVFKWSTKSVAAGRLSLRKAHPMVEVSIRKLYVGEHRIELLINGRVLGEATFELSRSVTAP